MILVQNYTNNGTIAIDAAAYNAIEFTRLKLDYFVPNTFNFRSRIEVLLPKLMIRKSSFFNVTFQK